MLRLRRISRLGIHPYGYWHTSRNTISMDAPFYSILPSEECFRGMDCQLHFILISVKAISTMDGGSYIRDRNLTFKQKLALQYEAKKRKYEENKNDPLPNCAKKLVKFVGERPQLLDKTGQVCYFFGLTGIASWGLLVAIPYLYDDFSVTWRGWVQGFGLFCAFQIMMNWMCIRFVKSNYDPIIHGAKPSGIEIGEHIGAKSEKTENGECSVALGTKTSVSVNKSNTVYVATEMPKSSDEPPKRTAFPYFSWVPCLRCNRPRPPRCHHCSLCNTCILKRDYHCFIAGACVGYRNFRHFTVFIFWAVVGATYGTMHMLPFTYYYIESSPQLSFKDLFLPCTVIRAILSFIEWKEVFLLILAYSLIAYNMWSISFLRDLTELIREGRTSFEDSLKVKVCDSRSLKEKLRSVFGYYWMLNFLFPFHFIWEPIEDPINWPFC